MLTARAQRLSTRGQDEDTSSFIDDALRQRGGRVDRRFATVQHQEHVPIADEVQDVSSGLAGSHDEPERRSDRICDGVQTSVEAQVHEADAIGELAPLQARHSEAERRLADPARAVDRYELMLGQQRLDGFDIELSADDAVRTPQRRGRPSQWRRCDCRDRSGKGVTAPRDGNDVTGAVLSVREHSAQSCDLDAKTAFFDDHSRPDPREQLPLGDYLAGALDESDEDVELMAAYGDRCLTLQQATFGGEQPKRTELHAVSAAAHLR